MIDPRHRWRDDDAWAMTATITFESLAESGLSAHEAGPLLVALSDLADTPPLERWRRISRTLLTPAMPAELHRRLHDWAFAGWDSAAGPAPAWSPDEQDVARSNVADLMRELNLATFAELHAYSVREPGSFTGVMARRLGIRFDREADLVLDLRHGAEQPAWFAGARLNIVESCFQAPGDAIAVIFEDRYGKRVPWSYACLQRHVGRVMQSLRALGIGPGDRVAIAMPMTIEAVAIYLAIVAMGCSAVTVAESFSAEEMRARLDLAAPVCLFCHDVQMRKNRQQPLYVRLTEVVKSRCVVLPAGETLAVDLRPQDVAWDRFLVDDDRFEAVPAASGSEITLLFSSGTTGRPKAIPWNHCTPLKCAFDAHLHHDIHAGDVLCWPTNLGWMMGPWLVFASLINRATLALSHHAPTTRPFAEFVQDAKVTMLGLVPSIVSAWRSSDCLRGLDWSRIRCFSSTGECSEASAMFWLMGRAGYKPIIEYCGGTEVGGGYVTGSPVHPCVPGLFACKALGSDWVVLDEHGAPARQGEVFLQAPALGLSTALVDADHHGVYYEGAPTGPSGELLRRHGDCIEALPGGYYRAHGRTDDTMNLGGIKVSSVQIEEILSRVDGVKELAAVAVPHRGGGPDRLILYACLHENAVAGGLKVAFQKRLHTRLNPLFHVSEVVLIDAIPRTASNKVMRRTLRADFQEREARKDPT